MAVGTRILPALAVLLALPQATGAQEAIIRERPPGMRIEREGPQGKFDLLGFVGWLAPLADLSSDPETFTTVVKPNLALGVDGTLWVSPSLGLGVQGFYAPTELQVKPAEPGGDVPGDAADLDYWSATANLVYRPGVSGPAATVQPFFSIGGGVRHLAPDGEAAVGSSTDPVGSVGAGTFVRILSGLNVRADLRYLVSRYESPGTGESRFQHDFLVVVGLGWRIY